MAPFRLVAGLALVTACYRQDPELYSTLPEPTVVEGPPGGVMDAEWQAGYVDDNAAGTTVTPSSDPQDPGYVMGSVSEGEIDGTLYGYGEWIEVEGYGRVWRPYATVVGVDFTPYETCGTWVWTDWGWMFACEWEWGWLPFHYGRWGWFDDYWGWVPDDEWSPAWVEWRSGGGYVGWRPLAPVIRDHRNQHRGPWVRDHRDGSSRVRDHRRLASAKDWQWRFAADSDFGKSRIRAHLFKGLAEGLRVTKVVTKPSVHVAVQPVQAAGIMGARLTAAHRLGLRDVRSGVPGGSPTASAPTWGGRGAGDGTRVIRRPPRQTFDAAQPPVYQPTYQPPVQPPGHGSHGVDSPSLDAPERVDAGDTPTPPTRDHDRHAPAQPPITIEPSPTYQPPERPSYTPPSPPTRAPDRSTTWTPPPRPTYTPSPSTRAPSSSWTPPPSRAPSSSSSSSWNPSPSRSSSSSSSSNSPSRSSSSSSSYSPSRSSSSSSSYSPSRSSSSSSSSSPSRSSSSSSSYSSSSSSSRSSSGGGWSGGRSHRR